MAQWDGPGGGRPRGSCRSAVKVERSFRAGVRATLALCSVGTGLLACAAPPVIVNRTPSNVPRNDSNAYLIEADVERGSNQLVAVTARIDGLDWMMTAAGVRYAVSYLPSPCTQAVAYELLVDYKAPLRSGGFSPRTSTVRSPVVGSHAMGIDGVAPSTCPTTFAHVFRVNTLVDAVDTDTRNAICDTSAGACSLRAAVMQANALSGQDLISVPPGEYWLDLEGPESPPDARNDLDITDGVAIVGEGPGVIIRTRSRRFRLLEVHPLAAGAFVSLQRLDLSNGGTESGGALRTRAPTRLESVRISNNTGNYKGAAIFNEATLQLERCTVVDNGSVGAWGAVYNTGSLLIRQSYIGENTGGIQGAIVNESGRLTIVNSTFNGNHAGLVFNGSAISTNVTVGLKNVTVLAGAGEGPIFRTQRPDAWVILQNSIVSVEEGGQTLCTGQILSSGVNYLPTIDRLDRCSVAGESDDVKAIFHHDPLSLHGGETLSAAPRSDSEAVDGATVSCPVVDQGGTVRPLDGNSDGVIGCDLGAHERFPS